MGDELKRYRWYYNGMLPDSSGGLCKYEDAAATIEQLKAQLAQAREQNRLLVLDVEDDQRQMVAMSDLVTNLRTELQQAREQLETEKSANKVFNTGKDKLLAVLHEENQQLRARLEACTCQER